MPGNVGGGKDPCFWCAGERGNRAVIDDESTTPRNSADLSIPLCRSAKGAILVAVSEQHARPGSHKPAFTEDLNGPVGVQGHCPACRAHPQGKPPLPILRPKFILQPAQALGDGFHQRLFLIGFGPCCTFIRMPLSTRRPSPSTPMI